MTILYRLLLRCYPRAFRLRFAEELTAAFDAGLHARRRLGVWSGLSFTLSRLADAVLSGLAERWAQHRTDVDAPWPGARGASPLWMQDLRFAARTIRRQPAFAGMLISIMALGIGATTAVFSVVDAVLLRPLPYAHADRLVHVETRNDALKISGGPASYPDFADWRAAGVFEDAGIYQLGNAAVRLDEVSERLRSGSASASLFSTLGIQPLIGRLPTAEEDRPGARPVVLLTSALWRRRFGSDADVLTRAVMVDGKSLAIIGVLPDSFRFAGDPELWMTFEDDGDVTTRMNRYLDVVARLRPGMTRAQVDERLTALCRDLGRTYPESNRDWTATTVPWQEAQTTEARPQLMFLAASVGLVLLISCVNVAMLLLVRSAARSRELAVRVALGASRTRIVSQLLVESLAVSLIGGGVGVGLAIWWVSLFTRFGPADIPRFTETAVNGRVLLFAAGTSCLSAVLFGLIPALQSSRPDLNGVLQAAGRTATMGRSRRVLSHGLLIAETAISLILMIGAALMVKSFVRLVDVDAGFRTDHLLTFHLPLPTTKFLVDGAYQRDAVRHYFDDVLARLDARPEVVSAAATLELPLAGGGYRVWQGFAIAGRPDTDQRKTLAVGNSVTPRFFATMEMPIRRGRGLAASDSPGSAPVVVVSETFARTFTPEADPVGQRLRLEGETRLWEIVGVVGDVKPDGLDSKPNPVIYRSFAQDPKPFMAIVVRTHLDPAALAPSLAAAVRDVDRDVPPYRVRAAADLVARSLAARRFGTMLVAAFAGAAALLALTGLYAVISHLIAQSTREIGLRVALGADRAAVLRMVLRQGLGPSCLGLLTGTVIAALSAPGIHSLLYGVEPLDPVVLLTVPWALGMACLLACVIPARRALRVDPAIALRTE